MSAQALHSKVNRLYEFPAGVSSAALSYPSLARALSHFAPIHLDEMQDVALLRRIDTKVVIHETQLVHILGQLSKDYDALYIDGRRIHRYRTLYFDTPEYDLYHQHHNGQRSRYKVRMRSYEDSNLAFLEVKRKTNQGLTIKKRIEIPGISTYISAYDRDFLASAFPYPADNLQPALWNNFQRVTLVSKHRAERLTLDVGLSFRIGSVEIALPGVAVAEVKQSAYSMRSEFIGHLRTLGVHPMSFSKYCVGISLLVPQVKHNSFKPLHLLLNRILQGEN